MERQVQLIIVRHAAAEPRDATRWPDDAQRPLTAKGSDRFAVLASALGRMQPDVQRVLSSRWTRAWQTAELLHVHANWPQPEPESALELAGPEAVAEALTAQAGVSPMAIVGHEPTLSELISLLLTGELDRLAVALKKGAAVCLNFSGEVRIGAGELRWMVTPSLIRR